MASAAAPGTPATECFPPSPVAITHIFFGGRALSSTVVAGGRRPRKKLDKGRVTNRTEFDSTRECESKMDLWAEEGRSIPKGGTGVRRQRTPPWVSAKPAEPPSGRERRPVHCHPGPHPRPIFCFLLSSSALRRSRPVKPSALT